MQMQWNYKLRIRRMLQRLEGVAAASATASAAAAAAAHKRIMQNYAKMVEGKIHAH